MKTFLSSVEILDDDEIARLQGATLHILETIGGRLPHPRILELFCQAGARVDFESSHVWLPPVLVENALRETPKSEAYIESSKIGGKTFFRRRDFHGAPGNQATIVDYGAIARRQGTREDVVKGIVLCNELPYLDGCMPLVTPADVAGPLGDIYGYYLCALYSKKPFSIYLSDLPTAQTVLQMQAATAGEAARAGDDPRVNFLLEPNGSLSFCKESLEIALAFAEAGQNVTVGPMTMAGLDAPYSLAGALLIQNAENLLGLVMNHLLGLSGSWSAAVHSLDPRSTMCSFGSPNHILLQIGAMQLGRSYGFQNFWLNLGLTDACVPDFQSGFEKGASAMAALLAGAGGVGAMGIVGADQATSFEQLVIDNEWASYLNHVFRQGFEVNDDTLAMEVIEAVGVGGSYLGEEHTVRHVRKSYWKSKLFNQGTWDAWMQSGGHDLHAQAHTQVERILAQHYPPAPLLQPATVQKMDAILLAATEALENTQP